MNVIFVVASVICFQVSAVELKAEGNGDIYVELEHLVVALPAAVVGAGGASDVNQVTSSILKSANHFFCTADEFEDQELIFYGTKSWTFPAQDVNLTLSYPTAKMNSKFPPEDDVYVILGFKVILYIDGMETKGYITGGGIRQESIVLTFVSPDITSLSYEFWLYGLPKSRVGLFSSRNLCQ